MTDFLIKKGIAKDIDGANRVQIIMSIVLLILAAVIIIYFGLPRKQQAPDLRSILPAEVVDNIEKVQTK